MEVKIELGWCWGEEVLGNLVGRIDVTVTYHLWKRIIVNCVPQNGILIMRIALLFNRGCTINACWVSQLQGLSMSLLVGGKSEGARYCGQVV